MPHARPAGMAARALGACGVGTVCQSRHRRGPRLCLCAALALASAAGLGVVAPAGADEPVRRPAVSHASPGKGKEIRRAGLAPVFWAARAFRDAPAPGFERLRMRTVASDSSHEEQIDYAFVGSDGVVTAVTEVSEARFRNLDGATWRQRLESESHYVLGGLLFVEGDWSLTRTEEGGLRERAKEGGETRDFTKIAGRLFPLAVGNTLELAYRSRIKTAPEFVENEARFEVLRTVPGASIHPQLTEEVVVIDVEYRERFDEEVHVTREQVFYAPELGWPARTVRQDPESGVETETRLVDFVRRRRD